MITGGCLCGAVRFEITAPPKWVAHCHCSLCRRAHAAAYVTWTGFPEAALRLTAGADLISEYRSSPPARRQFCSSCGTQLFFRAAAWPDEVHVPLALLEGEVGMVPQVHVWFSDRVPWAPVEDGLPRKGGASGLEPL